ncbi:DgyrCDS2092 [Dimorphilus gyrociliatus]|uniref:Alpha-galactosidase n=1 Tax=Dimorphilus gyrociliatus TaxID=2664684 RepID=A0A7I8VEB4_9ANNE|nr:DgyrCDS2092 [Dimorphilus gyrociliatus]
MKGLVKIIFALCFLLWKIDGLDNGLAKLPPMGWMSWERFMCNIDCVNYPNDCISENLIKSTADALVKYGFKEAGYKYVSIDDCWLEMKRDHSGQLVANRTRFPSGIPALADYLHNKDLKFGIYQDPGNMTCQRYPGSWGHIDQDAKTFANWKVDMLKFDGCFMPSKSAYNHVYIDMKKALNATGRHILYFCEWPSYVSQVDMRLVAETCNAFRTYNDIEDEWTSIHQTMKFLGDHSRTLSNITGPGKWNDPDQLVIGNFGLSFNQEKLQMALWCIVSAPLYISADVRQMNKASRDILLNKLAISINQDPLGKMGYQIRVDGQVRVWRKEISPVGSYALAITYENIAGGPKRISYKLSDLGFVWRARWNFTEVFEGKSFGYGIYKPWYTLNGEVNPTGVLFLHAQVLP